MKNNKGMMPLSKYPIYFETWLNPDIKSNNMFNMEYKVISESYPTHRHNFVEFSCVVEGNGSEIINGQSYPMSKGTFSLLLPYQVHEIRLKKNEYIKLYNCNLSLNFFFGTGATDFGLKEILFTNSEELLHQIQLRESDFEVIKNLCGDLYKEFHSKNIWNNYMFKAKIVEIIILFDRVRRIQLNSNKALNSDTTVPKNIWDIVYYIHTHYREDLSLQKLAKMFYLSVPYLSTLLTKQFGISFVNLITEVRLRHACGLLASTDLKITDIAMEVGYDSYNSFSRVFRKKVGISATDYRKKFHVDHHYN